MNFSNFYIKAVQENLNLKTYTEVMNVIGGSYSHMSMIKSEDRALNNKQVAEIAKILGIDEGVILAGVMADKAKTKEEKNAWKKLIAGYGNLPRLAGLELILC